MVYVELATDVVLFPFRYLIWPVVYSIIAIISHLFVIPVVVFVKLVCYTFIYIPAKPILFLLDVERSNLTFKLLSPQVKFFAIQLIHYVMVGIIVGIVVGWITGVVLRLLTYLLLPKTEKPRVEKPKKGSLKDELMDFSKKHKSDNQRLKEYRDSISEYSNKFSQVFYEDDDGYSPILQRRIISKQEESEPEPEPESQLPEPRVKVEPSDSVKLERLPEVKEEEDESEMFSGIGLDTFATDVTDPKDK